MNWSELFVMLITFVFINNVVLNQFLGMCPFMGVSKKSSSALGMGAKGNLCYRSCKYCYLWTILSSIRTTWLGVHGSDYLYPCHCGLVQLVEMIIKAKSCIV